MAGVAGKICTHSTKESRKHDMQGMAGNGSLPQHYHAYDVEELHRVPWRIIAIYDKLGHVTCGTPNFSSTSTSLDWPRNDDIPFQKMAQHDQLN